MITSSGKFIVESGGTAYYDTADVRIFVQTLDETGDTVQIELRMFKNTTDGQVGQYIWRTTAATIIAETGTGTGEFLLFFTACQLAVKTYLSGLNGAITFTIV
jgi:hypothetical protein